MGIDGTKMVQNIYQNRTQKFVKSTFVSVLPTGNDKRFRRHAYFKLDNQRKTNATSYILIHYVGDDTIQVPFPHGNSKHSNPSYHYREH